MFNSEKINDLRKLVDRGLEQQLEMTLVLDDKIIKLNKIIEIRFKTVQSNTDKIKNQIGCLNVPDLKQTQDDILAYLGLEYEDRSKPARLVPKEKASNCQTYQEFEEKVTIEVMLHDLFDKVYRLQEQIDRFTKAKPKKPTKKEAK